MNTDELVPIILETASAELFSARRFDFVSTHKAKAEALCAMELVAGGRYKFIYNTGARGNAALYRCVAHDDCPKLMRVVSDEAAETFTLEESGVHGDEAGQEKATGISHVLRHEVDAMLLGGAGPLKCLKELKWIHRENPTMLALLPTVIQLKNRKAYLRKRMEDGWEIQNPAALLEWASGRMCESKAAFFGSSDSASFSDEAAAAQDALIVLRVFEHDVDVDGATVKSFGFVFSSRRVMGNIRRAVDGQGDSVLGVADGTYKLHFGGWTLVNFGTYCTRYERGVFSKHYVPWTFMFVRTEHTAAYRELFETTREFGRMFFDVDVNITMGSLDHAACIANAFQETWPSISLLTCWPHLVRKAKDRTARLTARDFFEDVIHPHIKILHESRSQGQFDALSALALSHWREEGEEDYAEWFESTYLTIPWSGWHAAASGEVAGVLPSQNALEAFHRVIKKVCVNTLRANTATVLNDSLPGILRVVGDEPPHALIGHFCEGPLPAEYVVRARTLLSDQRNYMMMRTARSEKVAAIMFNAADFVTGVANPHRGVDVSQARVSRSLSGTLVANRPMTDAKLLYQSLHQVIVLSTDCQVFQMSAVWTKDMIVQVIRCFRCDCIGFRQSGWVCEHVVATMALLKLLSIDDLVTALPIRRKPGGQVKARGPLARDTVARSDARFFTPSNLCRLLTEFPARPVHWRIMKKVKRVSRGRTVEEHVLGTVATWVENGGRYKWRVRYADGKKDDLLDAEALANALSYSYSLGTDVMGTG